MYNRKESAADRLVDKINTLSCVFYLVFSGALGIAVVCIAVSFWVSGMGFGYAGVTAGLVSFFSFCGHKYCGKAVTDYLIQSMNDHNELRMKKIAERAGNREESV